MIAIIALLIAVLVPALGMAKRQAQVIVCRSNLRQLGQVLLAYATDNRDYVPDPSEEWIETLLSYSNDSKDILCCPKAAKPVNRGGRHPFASFPIAEIGVSDIGGINASYGINGWVCKPQQGQATNSFGLPTSNNWKTINVNSARNVPLLFDSMWTDCYPDTTNDPPPFDADEYGSGPMGSRQMRFFCINRHDGFVNGLFLDFSVRKTGLKELWKLKWHSNSDVNAPTPVWPDWMSKFKDY